MSKEFVHITYHISQKLVEIGSSVSLDPHMGHFLEFTGDTAL